MIRIPSPSRSSFHPAPPVALRLLFVGLFAVAAPVGSPAAEDPVVLPLWPAAPPGPASHAEGAERDLTKPEDRLIAGQRIIKLGHVSAPEMHVFLPPRDRANGGAVAVLPGGGFHILAWDLEGTEVATWLNELGYVAAVVKYRVPTAPHGGELIEGSSDGPPLPGNVLGPVTDTQRALSILRHRAEEWGIDPERVGVLGFSAGGSTAAHAAHSAGSRVYEPIDAADTAPCAPDFLVLVYPGGIVDRETGALRPHLTVTKDWPPTLFVMATDDNVDCENCTSLFVALKRAGVPSELHLFAEGGHGYGLRPTELPVTRWPRLAADWLARTLPAPSDGTKDSPPDDSDAAPER